MIELPKHIINSINKNETSIGEHPSLPPDDENKFLLKVIKDTFYKLSDGVTGINELKETLPSLVTMCHKNESNSISSLEELCLKVVNDLMPIPDDTIDIDACIVNNIDVKQQRMVPEDTVDFSFDSISDMNYLTDEVYKRRMLNSLIYGASMYYSNNVELYLSDLYKINPELPLLYTKILKYNNILLYTEKDNIKDSNTEAGVVDVYIEGKTNSVKIESKGIIFPILLCETIKGLLELAISYGLPKERDKADYVIKKSDFKYAENWDMRIGLPLWMRIVKLSDAIGMNMNKIGINFFFMQLSMFESNDFNSFLQEVFAGTKRGAKMLYELMSDITIQKEKDEFIDYVNMNNDTYQINDNDYFNADELIVDCQL
jgi:hypothetical protein